MLAEVLATIASIGNWFIHDLLRLRYLAWFLTSYFGTTLYINTELNSHVGTRGHRSVETNRLGHQGGGQELMEALASNGIAHTCRSAVMFQHVAASTHAHNMYISCH